MPQKILLNVGAGPRNSPARLPPGFCNAHWREVRVDIDPNNEPDIVGSMLDMATVDTESVDAVFSSHSIEHLYPAEVGIALQEFHRVLKPDGVLVIICPDLQAAAEMIAADKLLDTVYVSPSGTAVTPFDIVYSHRGLTGRDKPFMAHHCGFTRTVLIGTLKSNGFPATAGARANFELCVVASRAAMTDDEIQQLANVILQIYRGQTTVY